MVALIEAKTLLRKKAIFCGVCKATKGSSCRRLQKKVSEQKVVAKSRNSFKKKSSKFGRLKKWQATYIAPLNHIPLLRSHPGGVCRSWSCRTCRCKYTIFLYFCKCIVLYKNSNVYCKHKNISNEKI